MTADIAATLRTHDAYRKVVSKTHIYPGVDIVAYVLLKNFSGTPPTVKDVLSQSYGSTATVKRALSNLAAHGFLKLDSSADDKRVKIVKPTSSFLERWTSMGIKALLPWLVVIMTVAAISEDIPAIYLVGVAATMT